MRPLQVVIAAALAALVVGCATPAQRQYQAASTGAKAALEQFQMCATANYNSPEAAPLRAHVPFKFTDATLEQLSDPSKITEQERAAVLTVHLRGQECRRTFIDAMSRAVPSMVPIFAQGYARADDNLLALLRGDEAWGEFVRQGRDNAIATTQAGQSEAQRVTAGFEAEHRAEMEQRQRTAAMWMQWSQTQQIINAMNRPQYVAQPSPVINCTSSQIGSFVETNCH